MGNSDSFFSAITNRGKNINVQFDGGRFSFAFGNEIALILDENSDKYYILNCDNKLFNIVKKKVKSGLSVDDLKSFWVNMSKKYEISRWSDDFEDLEC